MLDAKPLRCYRPGATAREVARGEPYFVLSGIFRGGASRGRLAPFEARVTGLYANHRSRQQCRPGAARAQEEAAARGRLPRDEAAPPLREAVGEARPRARRSDPPRPQARAQARRARRSPLSYRRPRGLRTAGLSPAEIPASAGMTECGWLATPTPTLL